MCRGGKFLTSCAKSPRNCHDYHNKSIFKGLFTWSGGHKTKETYPTRPRSPTPCKQGLKVAFASNNDPLLVFLEKNDLNT